MVEVCAGCVAVWVTVVDDDIVLSDAVKMKGDQVAMMMRRRGASAVVTGQVRIEKVEKVWLCLTGQPKPTKAHEQGRRERESNTPLATALIGAPHSPKSATAVCCNRSPKRESAHLLPPLCSRPQIASGCAFVSSR